VYECIEVKSYREQDSVLDEEGELDNESDDSDYEMEMMKKIRRQSSQSAASQTSLEVHSSPMSHDSPMAIDD
jgi:hypothetical protein